MPSPFSLQSLLERRLVHGAAASAALGAIGVVAASNIPGVHLPLAAVFAVLFIAAFVSMFRVIGMHELGYSTLFGARIGASSREMHEGLHWLIPMADLVRIDTRSEVVSIKGIGANLADANKATVDISVAYSPTTEKLHDYDGFKDRNEVIETEVRAAVQQFGRACSTLDEVLKPEVNGQLSKFVHAWLDARSDGRSVRAEGRELVEDEPAQKASNCWGITINYVSVIDLNVPKDIRDVIEERERARIRVETRKYVDASMEQIVTKLIALGIPANQALDAAQILTNPDFDRTPQPIPPTLLMSGTQALGIAAQGGESGKAPPLKIGGKEADQSS
jgi:regulator of protease activity HflC (stomatin/prohibitin superfamily)